MPPGPSDLFEGLTFYIAPSRHLSRLIVDIRNHGGSLARNPSSKDITHVILVLDRGFRHNPKRPFVFGPSTLGDSEREQEYWTAADVAYYFHKKYTRPPIFVQDCWVEKCIGERRFYGRAWDYGGWRVNPQYSETWVNNRGWVLNQGRPSEDDDEPLRRNSDDRAMRPWSRRPSDDKPCTSATGATDQTSETDTKSTVPNEPTAPKRTPKTNDAKKRPKVRLASTQDEDVVMKDAQPSPRFATSSTGASNASPVRAITNETIKKEPLSPPQSPNAPSNAGDTATTTTESKPTDTTARRNPHAFTHQDVKEETVTPPRVLKALPSSTGEKATATPKSRELFNATKVEVDTSYAGKEVFPAKAQFSSQQKAPAGRVLSRANRPQPLAPTSSRVPQPPESVSPTTQLPQRMAGLGVNPSSPQTPTPGATWTQGVPSVGIKRKPGSAPPPLVTGPGGTLVATPIPTSVALEALEAAKAKRQRMAPPGLTIRTPNKPLSTRISMAADGPSRGHSSTQEQGVGPSQGVDPSQSFGLSKSITAPTAGIQPPPSVDLTAMDIDQIVDFASHSPTTPTPRRGQESSDTMCVDQLVQSPSATAGPSVTHAASGPLATHTASGSSTAHVAAGTPNTITSGVGWNAYAMSPTSPMSPITTMAVSPAQLLQTSPTQSAMLPMSPTQTAMPPMFPTQTAIPQMAPTIAGPSNSTNTNRPATTDQATQTTPIQEAPTGYVPPRVFQKPKYPVTIHVYNNNPHLEDLIVRYGGEIAPLGEADFIILPHGRNKQIDPEVLKIIVAGKSNVARVVSQDWVMHSALATGRMRGVDPYLLMKQ